MVTMLLKKLSVSMTLIFSFFVPILAADIVDTINDSMNESNDITIHKKLEYKSPLEFRQAIARYIKHTDKHYFKNTQRNIDDNVAYKKELRYLFTNYGRFSATTLMYRVRSAHQTMIKIDPNKEDEAYQKYEQICSVLLLTCAYVFLNDMRNEILQALDDIDNLIAYWRFQYNHKMRYFFNKSPFKWIAGKPQEKEIAYNIFRLERKQKQLYKMLGILTEHAHRFTTVKPYYEDCYLWIQELLTITGPIKNESKYNVDGSLFDLVAGHLELKLKHVSLVKQRIMNSLTSAQKPHHFVRNWIGYTTMIAIAGCCIKYHLRNPENIPLAVKKITSSMQTVGKSIVIDPMIDLWKVLFGTSSEDSITGIEEKVENIQKLSEKLQSEISRLTAQDAQSLKEYALEYLDRVLTGMKVANKDEIMKDAAAGELKKLGELFENTKIIKVNYDDNKIDLGIAIFFLMLDKIFGSLQQYPELIDKIIVPLVQTIGFLFVDIGSIVGDAVKNNFWTAKLAAFTPLMGGSVGAYKVYRWSTTRNYSPIRIALADVNALLIESEKQLDDHDYGKLMYLISKLRHKSVCLKDPLTDEFLTDIAKIESKQFSAYTKRDIVENMFNKYAFLGRVAV